MGQPGSGNSRWIRSEFLRSAGKDIDVLWLLPSVSLVEHSKALLLEQSSTKAIIENQIQTFDNWAEQAAHPDETIVNNVDLISLTERILEQIAPLGFEKVIDLPGFPKSASAACAELIESGVTPGKLRNFPGKNRKLSALAMLLEKLLDAMTALNLITAGQLVFRLAEQIENGSVPVPWILFFDGFYDFTASQLRCFKALCTRCENIRFTLPVDSDDFSRETTTSPRRTYQLLESLGFQFTSALPIPNNRQSSLFRNLFTQQDKIHPSVRINTLEADTKKQLTQSLAMKIRRAKDTGAVKNWRTVGILCRTLEPYIQTIKETFDVYGIPLSIHGAGDPTQTAQGPTILAFLETIGTGQPLTRTERVARVRRIADMAVCLCKVGVQEKLQAHLTFEKDSDGNSKRRKVPLESISDLIESTKDPELIEHLEFIQSIEKAAAVDRISTGQFIDTLRLIVQTFAKGIYESNKLENPVVSGAAGTLRAFCRSLDQFENKSKVLKIQSGSWLWLTSRFRDYLQSTKSPLTERLADAVHVVDAMEGRSWTWNELYVLGMNKGEFPLKTGEDIYFNDYQREKLDPMLPTARLSKNEEDLLFCFAVQAAKKRLVLARHCFDEGGSELTPSFYINELSAILSEKITEEKAEMSLSVPVFSQKDWLCKKDAVAASAHALGRLEHFGLTDSVDYEIGRYLYEKRMGGSSLPKNAATWIRPRAIKLLPEMLQPDIKELLIPFSVSGIEQFIACPFRNFAGRMLRPKSLPQIPALDAMLLGQIAHNVLREYFAKSRSMRQKNRLHSIFRSIRAKATAGLDISFDNEQELERLESAVGLLVNKEEEDWLTDLGAEPFNLEWPFECNLTHGDLEFPFHGRIDRVDKIGDALLVIDYKLSSGEISKKEFKSLSEGLLPQLPVYCAAIRKILGQEVIGAQIERIRHIDRSGFARSDIEEVSQALSDSGSLVLESEEFAELLENAMEGIFGFCRKMLEGLIEINPRDPKKTCRPDRCDYYDICRVDL